MIEGHPIIPPAIPDTKSEIPGDPITKLDDAKPGKDLETDINYKTFYEESINSVVEDVIDKLGMQKTEENMKQILNKLVDKFNDWIKSPDFRLDSVKDDKKIAQHAIDSAAKRRGLDPNDLKDLKKIIKLYVGENE